MMRVGQRWMGAAGATARAAVRLVAAYALLTSVALAADEADDEKPVTTKPAAAAFPSDTNLASAVKTPPRPAPQPRLSARLRVQYDYRAQGDARDNDLYGYLTAEGRDLAGGHLDFYGSGRLKTDLDKSSGSSLAEDPYLSVDEANGVTEQRLLQLYGDVHSRDRQLALRAGRQYVEIADYLHLDGAQIMYRENEAIGGRIYGGQPVSYYTSVSGDYAAGASVVGRPWEGNRTRVTAARYHDDSEGEDDQHYFLDVRQQLSDAQRARGQLSILNDEFRMGRADWYLNTPDGETDLALGASYWGSFDAKTRAYSPLYDVLGQQDPYAYGYARLTQQLVPHWFLSPGIALRFADADESSYRNSDYENYDLALTYEPSRAFSASVALEYWNVDDDDSFLGVSGEVRYRHGRTWEVAGGVSYAEYTYDSYSDIAYTGSGGSTVISESGTVSQETPYVKTYFLRTKWRLSRALALRLQGDIEDDDVADDIAYRGRASVEVRL